MAQKEGGHGRARSEHDKRRAARMKALGICRTTARCGGCYAIVTVDSWKSRWTHVCRV